MICGQSREELIQISDAIREECCQAMESHGRHNSFHESYAVILEELDEFWDIVKQRREKRDTTAARKELIQVAAMCMRAIHDLGLSPVGGYK